MPTDFDAPKAARALSRYDFRGIHPGVSFGTASDRYGGWIGQIYSDRWVPLLKKRRKKLGAKSYTEAVVPTAAVAEYFEHFSVLELDFTFYRPLIEADGNPGPNHRVLERYLDHAPDSARFLIKAPQMFCAPTLPGGGVNADYLNRAGYDAAFGHPLQELLGSRLLGVVFEQGYLSRGKSPTTDEHVESLDTFCNAAPLAHSIHFEVRSPHLLSELFFDWLASTGHGYVFSHWTWLPSIKKQWHAAGDFSSADGQAVLRLLTPRKMPYAKAYDLGHPFDQAVPALRDAPGAKEMVDETVALAVKAFDSGRQLNVIVNNRAWGNAPELAVTISRQLLAFERKRSRGMKID